MFITFSGLDGAGKSTLINQLKQAIEAKGQKVTLLTMYDHIGLYPLIRGIRAKIERLTGVEIKKDRMSTDENSLGIQMAKRGPLMTGLLKVIRSHTAKKIVYIFDLLLFLLIRLYVEKINKHVLIMDRYFYDSLADIAQSDPWGYISFFLKLAPTPNLPIFIDVPPEVAFSRKKEFPLDYMKWRYTTYKRIFQLVNNPFYLVNDQLDLAVQQLKNETFKRLGA